MAGVSADHSYSPTSPRSKDGGWVHTARLAFPGDEQLFKRGAQATENTVVGQDSCDQAQAGD